MKFIPFLIPILFFFLSARYGAAMPSVTVGVGLFLWFGESREPPRLIVWGAGVFAAVVGYVQEIPLWLPAVGVPFLVLAAVELLSRARSQAAALGGMIILATCAIAFPIAARPGAISGGSPERIVVIGDSLSAGVVGGGTPWPELLAREFGAEVANLSHPGDTLESSWNRWSDRVRQGRWLDRDENWKPDLVILLLGGNDVLRRRGVEAIERDLRLWAEELQKTNAEVLLVAVPGALLGDRLPGIYQNVAGEHGFHFMSQEALRSIFTNRTLTTDGVHLNPAGAEFFAAKVAARIRGE